MFGLVVRFQLKPGSGDAFDELAATTLEAIRSDEPGTLVYACHRVEGDPDARMFYEIYRDREAFEAHELTEHVRLFLTERAQFLAESPRVEFLSDTAAKGLPVRAGVTVN